MRVKKLQVTGFKSFLEKTTYDFSVPITGIVGPNGCGKSNVVDAIKWVTGELSFKQLRGRSMEDLIFAGSELRPPTGMAEVNMVLDNESGSAPPQYNDYAEISIVRRIFRDGTSEFFINKTPCRLRDIIDLFLDTGIGQSSYSIIEQGRVGLIVSSKSDDRRGIIEEAAGITKYKSRKRAAERKMDYTRQNLQRVSDVIGELNRQIRSLERQAKKAERYRAVREEARDLDLALSSRDYLKLKQEIQELGSKADRLSLDLDENQTELTAQEGLLERSRVDLMEKERVFEEEQAKLMEQATLIANLESRVEGIENEIEQLSQTAVREEERSRGLETKRSQLQEKLGELSQKIDALSQERMDLEEKIRSDQDEETSLRSDLAEVERQLNQVKSEHLKLITDEADCRNQVSSHVKQIGEIDRQMEGRKTELEKVSAELAELEQTYTRRQQDMGIVTQLRFGFERDQAEVRKRLETLGDDKVRLEKELSECNQALEGIRSRLAALKEFDRTYQGYEEGVRALMVQKDKNGQATHRISGVFGDLIRAKRGYERAIEAALSEKIECLVVEEPKDALDAIAFLKGKKKGRGAFLPARLKVKSRSRAELPSTEGVIGYLRDYVECDEKYQEAVGALIHDVVVVSTLERALELWDRDFTFTMVTPEGDLVTRQGIIVGGSWEGERGVLEIRREIEELEEALAGRKKDRWTLERNLNRTIHEYASTNAALGQVQEELEKQQQAAFDHEKDFHRIEEALRRTREMAQVVETEKGRLIEERGLLEEELAEAKTALEGFGHQRTELEAKVESESRRLEESRGVVEAHQARLTEKKVGLASLNERFESIQREEVSLSEQLETARVERDELLQSAERNREEAENKKSTLVETRGRRQELIGEHEKQREKVSAIKSDHDERAEEIRVREEEIKKERTKLGTIQTELNESQMKLQEERLRQDHLIEQIQERYDMSLAEHVTAEDFEILQEEEIEGVREKLGEFREKLSKMGDVNLGAIEEVHQLTERYEFLNSQKDDLEKTLDSLTAAIRKINQTTKERFRVTFEEINETFQEIFPRLFRGGKAKLILTDPENLLETGVDIVAQPPGKRLQNMNLLSGGEKAMTAIALLFAIFKYKSPPFCLLDEVDAPLDDVNVSRFLGIVKEMSKDTQFILITHNKQSMEAAEHLYGVTMEEPGVSRIVSVNLQDAMAMTERRENVSEARVA